MVDVWQPAQVNPSHHQISEFPSTSLWLFSSRLSSTCQARQTDSLNSCGFRALLFIVSLFLSADSVEGATVSGYVAMAMQLCSTHILAIIVSTPGNNIHPSEARWARQFVDLSTALKGKRFPFGSFSS